MSLSEKWKDIKETKISVFYKPIKILISSEKEFNNLNELLYNVDNEATIMVYLKENITVKDKIEDTLVSRIKKINMQDRTAPIYFITDEAEFINLSDVSELVNVKPYLVYVGETTVISNFHSNGKYVEEATEETGQGKARIKKVIRTKEGQ